MTSMLDEDALASDCVCGATSSANDAWQRSMYFEIGHIADRAAGHMRRGGSGRAVLAALQEDGAFCCAVIALVKMVSHVITKQRAHTHTHTHTHE